MYEISLTFPATSAVTISLHDTGAEQDSSMNAEEAPAAPAPAGNVPVFNTQTNRRMNRLVAMIAARAPHSAAAG